MVEERRVHAPVQALLQEHPLLHLPCCPDINVENNYFTEL